MTELDKQYFPYERVQGYGTLPNMEKVPAIIRDYLMDLPMNGYTPPDDNRFFRCRLMKNLYYDGARPLDNPLPTVQQKLSMVFDPDRADTPPTKKGYRIFTQSLTNQAEIMGQTIMRIVMGRVYPKDSYSFNAGIQIIFLTNYAYESSARTFDGASKTYAMACDAMRALSGVNIGAGVGTLYFDKRIDNDCNIYPISDEQMNVGYRLTMGLTAQGTDFYDQ